MLHGDIVKGCAKDICHAQKPLKIVTQKFLASSDYKGCFLFVIMFHSGTRHHASKMCHWDEVIQPVAIQSSSKMKCKLGALLPSSIKNDLNLLNWGVAIKNTWIRDGPTYVPSTLDTIGILNVLVLRNDNILVYFKSISGPFFA